MLVKEHSQITLIIILWFRTFSNYPCNYILVKEHSQIILIIIFLLKPEEEAKQELGIHFNFPSQNYVTAEKIGWGTRQSWAVASGARLSANVSVWRIRVNI